MRKLFPFASLFFSVVMGCSGTAPGPVHMTEIECRLASDCASGSYCDSFTSLCGWDCRGDSECAIGMTCDLRNGRCVRADEPTPTDGPVVVITTIDLGPTTLVAGSLDEGVIGFFLENRSSRPIEMDDADAGVYPVDASALDEVTETALQGLHLFDATYGVIAMGPYYPVPTDESGHHLDFTLPDGYVVAPGERVQFLLRTSVGLGVDGRYIVRLGASISSSLIQVLRYADTGEDVPADLIEGNASLTTDITIIDPAAMSPGDAVVIADLRRGDGIMIPSSLWQPLSELCFTTYGAPARVTGLDLLGYGLGSVSQIHLLDEMSGSHGTGAIRVTSSNIEMTIDEALTPGVELCYDLYTEFDATALSTGSTMWGSLAQIGLSSGTAENVAGEPVPFVVVSDASYYVLRQTKPFVTRRPLSTNTIVNGLPLDLYRAQIDGAFGRSLALGSATLRVNGLMPGRSFSGFQVWIGFTPLADGEYRVFNTASLADLADEPLMAASGAPEFTIVFPGGRDIGPGAVITVSAIPEGFLPGDTITVGFADRRWLSHPTCVLTSFGTLDCPALDPISEALVWTDSLERGQWTGAGLLTELAETEVFTR